MKEWMKIEEAAKYLALGKTVLYRLAQERRIPSNKVGKKWLFEKAQLDGWIRANRPFNTFFTDTPYRIEDNLALREPQREAYAALDIFFQNGGKYAIVQIPVGCGKSGLAAIIPFGIAKGRILIISPNLTIKDGLFESFDITNRQKCFWRKAKILSDADMSAGPLACTLETGNISIAEKCHIVVTNIHQLATNVDKWLTQFHDDFFDLIIVDEAHHSAAASWKKVLERFPKAKAVLMTATPFRSDKQEIEGELVYRYPFRSATLKGYIKRLKAHYVVPKEITLSFIDGSGKTYTLAEVLKLKEEDWFSRSIALSPACNQHIVDNSLQKLEELRLTGTHHQLIAVACQINHARDIRSLYEQRGYKTEVIHNELEDKDKQRILTSLKSGALDCIVQVQMLGEGFDHPKLSVAAIFRPFRSLAPYVQFVGRIMRVVVQNNPSHPDNLGHIVTHIGMNLDKRLDEFKQFENDDEAFWERVIGGEDPEVPKEVVAGKSRLRLGESTVVNNEIVHGLWEEDFTTVEDEHIIAELQDKLRALGLDPSQAEQLVKQRPEGMTTAPSAEPFIVQPQKEWEESRKRLHEQVKRTANILLNNVKLEPVGTEIPYKFTSLSVSGRNNLIAAIIMVNREVDKVVPKDDRKDWTTEEFKKAITALEPILRKLVRQIKKVQIEYVKTN